MPPDPAREERTEQLREKVELARKFFDQSPNNEAGFRCLGEAGRLLTTLGYKKEAEWFDANDIGLGAANDIRLEALRTLDRILVELDSPDTPVPTQPPPTILAPPSQTTVGIAGPVASVQNAPGSTANISQRIENPTPENPPQSATVKAAYITAVAVIVAGIGAALITRDSSSKYPERPIQPVVVSNPPAQTRTPRPSPRTPVPTAVPDREHVAELIDYLCDKGVFSNPPSMEDRGAICVSLREVRKELGEYLKLLPADAPAVGPVRRMQATARVAVQDRSVFPDGCSTLPRFPDEPLFRSIERVREVFETNMGELEDMYSLSGRCDFEELQALWLDAEGRWHASPTSPVASVPPSPTGTTAPVQTAPRAPSDCVTETHWNSGTKASIRFKAPQEPASVELTAQYQDRSLLNGMWVKCPFWTGTDPTVANIDERLCGKDGLSPANRAGFMMTVEGCQTTSAGGGTYQVRCTLKNGDQAGPKNVRLCVSW